MLVTHVTADREALLSVISDPDRFLRGGGVYAAGHVIDRSDLWAGQVRRGYLDGVEASDIGGCATGCHPYILHSRIVERTRRDKIKFAVNTMAAAIREVQGIDDDSVAGKGFA